MVSGKHKSSRFKKIYVRTPGAKTVVHYRQRKVEQPKCAKCKCTLKGIPSLTSVQFKNLAKSKKKNERPYGGNLCSKCSRATIKEYARGLEQ